MVPNPKYCPTNLQDRAAWLQNLTTQFAQVATGLGFLPAVVTQLQNDNEDFQFCAAVAIETRLDNSETWSNAGTYYSSPAELVIPENPQGSRVPSRSAPGMSIKTLPSASIHRSIL